MSSQDESGTPRIPGSDPTRHDAAPETAAHETTVSEAMAPETTAHETTAAGATSDVPHAVPTGDEVPAHEVPAHEVPAYEVPPYAAVPAPAARRSRRVRVAAMAAAFALTAGGGVAVGAAIGHRSSVSMGATAAQIPTPRSGSGDGSGSSQGEGSGSFGFGGSGGFGGFGGGTDGSGSTGGFGGSDGSGTSDGSSTTTGTAATAEQSAGVVTVDSTLSYQSAEAAGTGIVLTSSGEILTNNHVIEGSTSISVTVVSTGKTYTARVVGTDATDDIAVLQLQGASGLTTAKLASSAAATGDAVTGVGNAGGTGTLTAAAGSVTAVGANITTQAEGSAASESLKGLIETDANIQSGDSGGPLFNSSGEVVGIDTAASSGGSAVQGYAIPIATATSIARQIESGQSSSTVTIGLPAFLGVELSPTSTSYSASTGNGGTGATVQGTVSGGPAAGAGITAGDTITAVDGTAVADADGLSAALAKHKPGATVTVTWTDSSGASHQASVTLVEGPAA